MNERTAETPTATKTETSTAREAAEVEIYTTMYCPFCWRAKELLDQKGVKYTEVDVGGDRSKRQEMSKRAEGGRTVPQIFINNTPIGGCDEMYALERQGLLDPMLGRAA